METKCYQMSFDGCVLNRGFWIYLWKVVGPDGIYFYLGRTGDSSSANAASPFARIGQHLNFRETARGNSLAMRLQEIDVNPCDCRFHMLAIGPLFQEEKEWEKHKPIRDKVAAIESALSKFLRDRGCNVLGAHSSTKPLDEKLLRKLVRVFEHELAKLN